MTRRRSGLLLVALLAWLLAPAGAMAVTLDEVAKEVKCPTCSTPLSVSDAPVARDMKEYIRTRIGEGASKEEIIDELEAEFGPTIHATPPKEGFDLMAWVVPIGAVLLGLGLIPVVVRAWRSRPPPAPAAPITAEDARRLDEELRRRST
jgi:cytochrome c-type biogenesis protein CcmH